VELQEPQGSRQQDNEDEGDQEETPAPHNPECKIQIRKPEWGSGAEMIPAAFAQVPSGGAFV